MILALLVITIFYALTIGWLMYGFTKINTFEYSGLSPKTNFSIIVPFRNEAQNLPILLESFSKLNYPNDLFEVILVDDASEKEFRPERQRTGEALQNSDPSDSELAKHYRIQIVKNIRTSNSPKKDAITTAMQHVKTDWVITTDADCVVLENWLLS